MQSRWALALLVLCAIGAARVHSYPDYFIQSYANGCDDQPTKALGGHGAPKPDSSTSILVTSTIAGAGRVACPGGDFGVKVTFPKPRLALVTTSQGEFSNAAKQCPNRIFTAGKVPVDTVSTTLSVPCSAAGTDLLIKVTSVESATGEYKTASFTLPVDTAGGACAAVTPACASSASAEKPGPPAFVPVTPSKFDLNQPGTTVATMSGSAAAASSMPNMLSPPVYTLRPVFEGNKSLWQVLHSLLMLAAFGLLMPLGVLLARHKWMFGRNPETGKVMGGWFWLHVITQILGILAAAGGIAIAILAFGWKDVPGLTLYKPHKWIGIGVMGMALLQLLAAPLRPKMGTKPRSCWNVLHWNWGRLTILAGCGNTIIGALLYHDYKDEPYVNWLLPCAVLIGLMGLLAMTLEAFKMQMQRTHRYNHKTQEMRGVMEAHKHSKRRSAPGSSSSSGDVEDASYPAVTHYANGSDGGPIKSV